MCYVFSGFIFFLSLNFCLSFSLSVLEIFGGDGKFQVSHSIANKIMLIFSIFFLCYNFFGFSLLFQYNGTSTQVDCPMKTITIVISIALLFIPILFQTLKFLFVIIRKRKTLTHHINQKKTVNNL